MKNEKLISFLLRTGVALVFLYAAVSSFLNPDAWVGFLPVWARQVVPAAILLSLFSLYEILLGLWVLSGFYTFHASLLAGLTLLAILFQNIGQLDILFRDVAILFAALALATVSFKKS